MGIEYRIMSQSADVGICGMSQSEFEDTFQNGFNTSIEELPSDEWILDLIRDVVGF